MFAVLVTLEVKPGKRDEFLQCIQDDAKHSLRDEPGCMAFHVVQLSDEANRFFLYEAYVDEAAFEHHKTTPHFACFAKAAETLLVAPPVITTGTHLIPATAPGWIKQGI